MVQKILVADDSPTIQKVVKITLADRSYELIEALSSEEAVEMVQSESPALILLDFNLAEKQSGYELARELKNMSPSTPILMFYGTFDTVNEQALRQAGVSDQIVKPFDSSQFINICEKLLEGRDAGTISSAAVYDESLSEDGQDPDGPSDQESWVMNTLGQDHEDLTQERSLPEEDSSESENVLHTELEEWGMSVPPVIDGDSSEENSEVPSVIGEYEAEEETKKDEVLSKFIPLDDLNPPPEEESSEESEFDENSEENSSEDNVEVLKDQLRDELEEKESWSLDQVGEDGPGEEKSSENEKDQEEKPNWQSYSADDFWTPDEIAVSDEGSDDDMDEEESTPEEDPGPIEKNVFEDLTASQAQSTSELTPVQQSASTPLSSVSDDKLKEMIHEYMDNYYKETIEKVVWEVIPDLAENLIREELKKLSERALSEEDPH